MFPCACRPGALLLHALSRPSTICPFPPLPALPLMGSRSNLRKQPPPPLAPPPTPGVAARLKGPRVRYPPPPPSHGPDSGSQSAPWAPSRRPTSARPHPHRRPPPPPQGAPPPARLPSRSRVQVHVRVDAGALDTGVWGWDCVHGGTGFVHKRGGGLLALKPTHPKKTLTQSLAEGKSSLTKRPLCGTPPQTPPGPPSNLIPQKQGLGQGTAGARAPTLGPSVPRMSSAAQ